MSRVNKNGVQQSMFCRDSNMVSIEEYRELVEKKHNRTSHEKKFMSGIIEVAHALDLPCVHIEYFCGNKFYPTCTGRFGHKHAPARAICPICGEAVLAVCVNRINKGLAGHYDILGIDWAMETKHKINKGKQRAKGDKGQKIKSVLYETTKVPHLVVNEDDDEKIWKFLKDLHNRKFPERKV